MHKRIRETEGIAYTALNQGIQQSNMKVFAQLYAATTSLPSTKQPLAEHW